MSLYAYVCRSHVYGMSVSMPFSVYVARIDGVCCQCIYEWQLCTVNAANQTDHLTPSLPITYAYH